MMRRVWMDAEGDIWAETDEPGKAVWINNQVVRAVADKFGTYDISENDPAFILVTRRTDA